MVRWTLPARRDLREIFDFIAQDSRVYARQATEEIIEKALMLDRFPKLGHVVAEIGNDCIREIISYPYRIVYEIEGSRVAVLAVVHGKRELKEEMIRRERGPATRPGKGGVSKHGN